MKVREQIYIAAMLVVSGFGVIAGLVQGEPTEDIVIFAIFAITMAYLGVR